MKEVSFTIHGTMHRLDITEVRELIQRLAALAEEAEQEPEVAITPPKVNSDGRLDVDAIRLFMSQFNADPAWLRNNANKLWARLGKLSARGLLPFDVYCIDCGRNVREPCPLGRWRHVQGEAKCFVMTPETILEHGSSILYEPTTLLGPKTLEHFKVLLASLQSRKDKT